MTPQLVQQTQQLKDALTKIVHALSPLQRLNEAPQKLWGIIDYRGLPAYIAIFSLIIALTATWLADRLRRKANRSNLRIRGVYSITQLGIGVSRLIITNESNHKAMLVEADVESILDGDTDRTNFLPVPLNWTHGQLTGTLVRRDIYGHQTVHLDVIEHNGPSLVLSTLIRAQGLEPFFELYAGKTELGLILYQESGQTLSCKVTVSWNGTDAPTITCTSA